jgi:UDP-glucose:(heptosyl)LPS alpha-1,3-glucosyltransferase
MKIALCHEKVLPDLGGCETYIADLARRLCADQHEVHLYACAFDAEALPAETIHHPIPAPQGPRFLRPWRFAAACAAELAKHSHDVSLGFIKTWGQDVLFPQGGLHLASVQHNLHKSPTWLGRALAMLGKWLSPTHWSYKWLERHQYLDHENTLIVVPSRFVQEHFLIHYRIGPDRVRIVPNAINPDRFQALDRPLLRVEYREMYGLQPEDVAGLFVGHNYRLKGLEPLLRAVALLPPLPFKLLVVGNPETRPYERLAARLGIQGQVRFLGFQEEVRGCFFAADFLLHPSFYDPCALVTLEALACGLPVITTRCNGASELLPPAMHPFLLDDPHDAPTLAHHIEMLCHPDIRAIQSRAARQAANAWTFEDHYHALLAVLREAAARKKAA